MDYNNGLPTAEWKECQTAHNNPVESGQKRRFPLLCDHSRFVVMVLAMLCMTAVCANSLLFNFTVICMDRRDANFSADQQGWLIAGTAVGGIVAIGPVPHLIALFGLRSVSGLFGLLSGLATLLQPMLFFSGAGFYAFLAVRIVQGLCLMPAMPAMSQITHHWANPSSRENALFLMVLSLYMQFSVVLTMPTAGALCASSWRWPSVYHLFGSLCLAVFCLFLLIYRNSPSQSPFISSRELSLLKRCHLRSSSYSLPPYLRMFSDPAVWSCLCAATSFGLAFWLFSQYLPIYLNRVLHFRAHSAGLLIAIPYLLAIFAKMLVPILDRFSALSPRFRTVLLPFFCQLINVFCYLLLGIWPASSPLMAQICFATVLCANGVGFVALANNCQLIARQHAHFILALFALVNYIITLVQPLIISRVAGENGAEQWSRIFFAYALVLFLLNLAFVVGAATRPRPWTVEEAEQRKPDAERTGNGEEDGRRIPKRIVERY